MKTRATPLLAIALCLAAVHSSALGQLVAVEDFEGYPADSELAGQGGGIGFGGSWEVNASRADDVTVVEASLNYSNGAVSADGGSRALQFAFDPAEGGGVTDGIMARPFETAPTGTVYMSLLFRDTVNTDFATDFIQWGFSDGTANPQASILRRNGTLQVRSTTTPANSVDSGIAAVVGATHLLVFKAEKTGAGNYDRISLFIDPDSELEPVTPSAVANVDSGLSSFPNFVARSAFHGLDDAFQIDNLVIGGSWEDVVISTAPAPFVITEIKTTPGGPIDLTWNAKNRYVYAVFASDDLANWLEVDDSITASGTTVSYQVTGEFAAPGGTRFFRVEERGRQPE